ncbi:MAG: inositol monophosphatase family protein [Planctomycetota bacterium]
MAANGSEKDLPCGSSIVSVIALLEEAGDELLGYRHQLLEEGLNVEKKGFRDLVTEADHAAEARLIEGLKSLFPGDSIYSEESGEVSSAGDRRWILDPLDGTTNFAHGHPFFAISAGLWDPQGPLAAVIHAPLLADTWWAIRGQGAWHHPVTGGVNSLHVKSRSDLSSALLATGFSYSRKELECGALSVFDGLLRDAREIRRGGSACLDLAHTAAGVFDAFWEFRLAPHDVAAGALLVLEAGGTVTDGFGGNDWLHGGSIVAGVPNLQAEIQSRVASVAKSLIVEGEAGR